MLALSACAGLLERDVSPEFAERFMGRPVNDVIAALGPPSLRIIDSDGSERLNWEWNRPFEARVPEYRSIGTGLITVTGYRREMTLVTCFYEIETDEEGVVIAQNVEGVPSFCRSRLPRK